MNRLPLALAAAGLLGLAALPASAALSSADRDFVQKAASGGMAEVQTAQLAQQRASSQQVKQFADRMIADHTQANTELQQIAEQENVTLPPQPTGKDAAAAKKLSGLNGAAFDKAYAQDELSDHQQDVALFRKEASSGQDPALKSFAQKTLPILQQHLQMAQALNSSNNR
jgi:putative membrane protein